MGDRNSDIAAGGVCAWQLPRDASGPPLARALLARTMTTLGLSRAMVDDGVLAVSECATNAYQHADAAGPYGSLAPPELWVFARTRPMSELVVSVFDADRSHLPQPAHAQPLDESGRGICILSAVTAAWGSRPSRSRQVGLVPRHVRGVPACPRHPSAIGPPRIAIASGSSKPTFTRCR
jgi:hypothetical protein